MSILKPQHCDRHGPSIAAMIGLLLLVQSLTIAGVQDAQSIILAHTCSEHRFA